MRVFVCDDEPLAVRRLVSLLEGVSEVEVVSTTTDSREALRLISETKPDLLLLDIEMPEVDGFDIVEGIARLQLENVPVISFITAYRNFAFEAYECGVLDFLPKPVRASRVEATVARARDALAGREARSRLVELERRLDVLRANSSGVDRLHVWVSRRGETVRVDLDQVERVAAEGAYVRLHVGAVSYLHREAISSILDRMDGRRFARVHRSHAVRIDQVSAIRRTLHGGGELLLRDGALIPLGRKYSRDARRRLGGGAADTGDADVPVSVFAPDVRL